MYKQTLCVTLPISAAVIIAAALFASAGDLNPLDGPIGPTMHDLQEIYDLVQQSSPCSGCTWEYLFRQVSNNQEVQAIGGSGVLHGLWLKPQSGNTTVKVFDGPSSNGIKVGDFTFLNVGTNLTQSNQFFELNVVYNDGIYLNTVGTGNIAVVTLLYRSATP